MPFLIRHKLSAILPATLAFLILPLTASAQTGDDCPVDRAVKLIVQSSPFPSLPGQAVDIGAFVEPVQGISDPTRTVPLSYASTDLGTYPVKQAQVHISQVFNQAGAHVLSAYYSGDFNYCGKA